jgi:hypothetical protein
MRVVLFIVALLISVLAVDTGSKKTNKRDLVQCGDKKRNAGEWQQYKRNTTAMCTGFFAATNDGTMTDQAQVRKSFFFVFLSFLRMRFFLFLFSLFSKVGMTIANEAFKEIAVELIEFFGGGAGVVVGLALDILWPTPNFAKPKQEETAAQNYACALAGAINASVIDSTLEIMKSDLNSAHDSLNLYVDYIFQNATQQAQAELQNALISAKSAWSIVETVSDDYFGCKRKKKEQKFS